MRISADIPVSAMSEEMPEGYRLLCDKVVKHPSLPIVGAFFYSELTDQYLIRCEGKDYIMDYDEGRSKKRKFQKQKSNKNIVRPSLNQANIIFTKKSTDVYEYLQSKKNTEGITAFVIRLLRQEMEKEKKDT